MGNRAKQPEPLSYPDGRFRETPRPLRAALSVLDRADGSCQLSQGETYVLVSVFGPIQSDQSAKSNYSRLQSTRKGTCQVTWLEPEPSIVTSPSPSILPEVQALDQWQSYIPNQLPEPNVLHTRVAGMRRRPSAEAVLTRLFSSTILLEEYPLSAIHLIIHVLNDDGGLMAAAIMASSLALMDAGIAQRGFLVALELATVLNESSSTSPMRWIVDPTSATLHQQAVQSSLWVFDHEQRICYNRMETLPRAWSSTVPVTAVTIRTGSSTVGSMEAAYRTASVAAETLHHWFREVMLAHVKRRLPETR
jgi:ribonuclease PH